MRQEDRKTNWPGEHKETVSKKTKTKTITTLKEQIEMCKSKLWKIRPLDRRQFLKNCFLLNKGQKEQDFDY